MRILSLGAGVQSTTLALMAAHDEIPAPDYAIFADTQWEPKNVYTHLAWLETQLPFEIRRVSAGDIRDGIRTRYTPRNGYYSPIPWHIVNPDGSRGMGRRQCTAEYKLEPIRREIRNILGVGSHDYIAPNTVEMLIGISIDEAHRMGAARVAYIANRYPLVELEMYRYHCVSWLKRHNYPIPNKSACIGCPYHDNYYWRDMRDNHPDEWHEAVMYDRILRQDGPHKTIRGTEYMHRTCKPLDEVNLEVNDRLFDLFGNECDGLCGV